LNDINLLIVDNHTTESGIHAFLSSLPSFIDIKTYNKRSPNELHRAMNYAIQYSKQKENRYINFIQDDYQFLYKISAINKYVYDAFRVRNDVVQLQTNLVWKYKKNKIGKISPVVISGTKWYYLHNKFPCDNGFTRISVYDQTGLYPKRVSIHGKEKKYRSGEAWFANKCKRYRRMLLSIPNMSMIMDCAYVRGNRRIGKYFESPNKYYLKPFDDKKKDQLKIKSRKNSICFIEDLIIPDGWKPDAIQKHNKRKISIRL